MIFLSALLDKQIAASTFIARFSLNVTKMLQI